MPRGASARRSALRVRRKSPTGLARPATFTSVARSWLSGRFDTGSPSLLHARPQLERRRDTFAGWVGNRCGLELAKL